MKASLRLFFFAVIFLLVRQSAFAQGAATGDLRVSVKDPKGNVVTNAAVTVRDIAKGLERAGSGDGQGGYSVRQLAPGTYSVTVDAPGFARTEATGVEITVGGMAELPVTLTVAGGKEIVEVSSEAENIETSRSSTTDTVGERRIDNLPINGRNYIQFTLTDSQVQRDSAPNVGAAPTSGLNMSGQRARSNLVNVDGADATDNSTNGVRSTVSQEAVQEFQIITNNYAAEYGRAAGGVVNIITRSGSNDFHGDVYGYLRNRNFQAVNPFSTVSNPAYTRAQGGVAFGGPIKKDKTYYYFAYETTRRHETGFSSIAPATNLGYYGLQSFDATGIFNPLLPPGTFTMPATAEQAAFLAPFAQAGPAPLPVEAYTWLLGASSWVALTGNQQAFAALPFAPGGSGPQQFPTSCNLITPALICGGLPASFQSLGSQSGNFPVFEGTSLYSLRIDHNINSRNRLTLRANVSPSTVTGIEVNGQDQPFGQNAYSRTSEQTYRDAAGVFQDTWTLGNNKVNEFRFQYARRGLAYFYNKSIAAGADPAVNIIGYAYIGREPYSFIQRVESRYQFTDNFSWTMGRHNTKFGVDFNYLPLQATFTVNYGGVYNFSPESLAAGLPAANSVQAYGAGIPSYIVQGVGNPKDSFSNKPLGLYWQDSWRVRSNVTLNLGARYDVEFPPTFAPPTGLGLPGYGALGIQKGIQTDKNNIQPRIGIAWNPKGDGKTVVRASYGIFYDHPLLGLYFLGDAADASKTGQLLFFGSSPCDGNPLNATPLNLNATNMFQGIQGAPNCLLPGSAGTGFAAALGYQNDTAPGAACGAGPNPQRFDPCLPNSPFLNQSYLTGSSPLGAFPLISQPFGYPEGKGFVYAYSQQINFSIEKDLGNGFAVNLAYNFNGGHHLNRPINANSPRGDLLVKNFYAAVAAAQYAQSLGIPVPIPSDPLSVAICPTAIGGIEPAGLFAPASMLSFFRRSGLNPSLAGGPCLGDAQALAKQDGIGLGPNGSACDPALAFGSSGGCVLIPFSDMDANESNGSSVYHGLSANLRKRFSNHYEFLASYTWSHAIDDSTDLQATLTPQDSYFPSADRSTSLFDQRHRFVFSGVYQSGKLSGSGFASKFFSNWTFAPLVELSSGRPFNIVTGSGDNFQFSSETGRPNIVPSGTPTNACGYPTLPSKYSRTGFFQEPCFADISFAQLLQPNALRLLDGNLGRNAGLSPWTVFNDLRIAKRVYFSERFNMDLIADMFNIANVYNVAAVSPLCGTTCNAGQATAAYDPRQFQFALKINW